MECHDNPHPEGTGYIEEKRKKKKTYIYYCSIILHFFHAGWSNRKKLACSQLFVTAIIALELEKYVFEESKTKSSFQLLGWDKKKKFMYWQSSHILEIQPSNLKQFKIF